VKILFFSLFLPHPRADHAAAFCGFKLVEHLARSHDVTVLSFVRSASEQQETEALRQCCSRVETVILPSGFGTKVRSRLKLLSLTPIATSQSYSREMACKLRALCAQETFDVLHAEYSPMGQYLAGSRLKCGTRALHVLDLLAPQMRNRAAHLPLSRRKLEYWLDAVLAPRYEARLCSLFDVVFAIAPRIRNELLAKRPGLNVVYVPPGVDLCPTPKQHDGRGKRLLFVGAMWREENVDAVLWFYHKVFPLIRAQVPEAMLTIAGGSPTEEVRALSADPHVHVTGYVDALLPWYLASDVSIAPVRIAGGVLCKILDAMAAGLPVITTSFGNDGVGAQPNKEILVANTPEEFAAQAVRLLANADLRSRLASSGQDLVRRQFSKSSMLSRFESNYLRHLSDTQPSPSRVHAWT